MATEDLRGTGLHAIAVEIEKLIQRNSRDPRRAEADRAAQQHRDALERRELRRKAREALSGELGHDARDLARHMVRDAGGQVTRDLYTLRKFRRALGRL